MEQEPSRGMMVRTPPADQETVMEKKESKFFGRGFPQDHSTSSWRPADVEAAARNESPCTRKTGKTSRRGEDVRKDQPRAEIDGKGLRLDSPRHHRSGSRRVEPEVQGPRHEPGRPELVTSPTHRADSSRASRSHGPRRADGDKGAVSRSQDDRWWRCRHGDRAQKEMVEETGKARTREKERGKTAAGEGDKPPPAWRERTSSGEDGNRKAKASGSKKKARSPLPRLRKGQQGGAQSRAVTGEAVEH